MQSKRVAVVLAAVLSFWCAGASVGRAQATQEYEAVLADALTEFEAGRWSEALTLFMRANDLYSNARVLRGIGMASFELRDYAAARTAFQQALAHAERPLTPAQRSNVEELLARSEGFVGRVRLQVQPAAATVEVDGTPATIVDSILVLNPGSHVLTFTLADHESEQRSVDVRGGVESTVVVTLRPTQASAPEPATPAVVLTAPVEAPVAGRGALWAPGWVSLGAGAGAGVAALLTGIFSQRIHDDLSADCGGPCPEDRQGDIDRGRRLARTSTALTFASVAALGAGVTLLILDRGGDDAGTTEVRTEVGLGRVAANLRLTF